MPATITLRTIPGCIERGDHCNATVLEPFGPSLGQVSAGVATVADVGTAVQAFGAHIRTAHPDASFLVSVSVRKGDRKPNGYVKAALNNGFGQEDFLHVVDKRTTQAVPAAPAAA